MRLAILLFYSAVLFGQSAASPDQPKAQATRRCGEEFGLSNGTPGRSVEGIDILSDTQGVDFRPYVKRMVHKVRDNWDKLIPATSKSMKGRLTIEFAIAKEGKIEEMCLVASSGDVALDRAAWDGIRKSNPFPPVPAAFSAPYLAVRFRFYYNADK